MKKNGRRNVIWVALLVLALLLAGCSSQGQSGENNSDEVQNPAEIIGTIILATTTSTQDSGLLDELLPEFTYDTGYVVNVVAVGSGKAMQMGKDGEADVLLVHSPQDERNFVAEGHSPARFDVMYNDFVLLGPTEDPAGIKADAAKDIKAALKKLYDEQIPFVSRGDESGTHKKELAIWNSLDLEPSGDWYVSAGKGMGEVITMANEMLGYTLSDRATWLNMKNAFDLEIVTEGDTDLFNQYGVMIVDPGKNDQINADGAAAFQEWILSEKAQTLIGEYGTVEYGQPLFTPNAEK